jgi:hypothetical protein
MGDISGGTQSFHPKKYYAGMFFGMKTRRWVPAGNRVMSNRE